MVMFRKLNFRLFDLVYVETRYVKENGEYLGFDEFKTLVEQGILPTVMVEDDGECVYFPCLNVVINNADREGIGMYEIDGIEYRIYAADGELTVEPQ